VLDQECSVKNRELGKRTGINIGPVGLGLWAVPGSQWGPAEDQSTLDAIKVAADQGVNFFDTADVYGGGRSEELLGKAIRDQRDRFTIATKIGWLGYNEPGGRSKYDSVEILKRDVELSLKRLGTDYVDVLQCHVFYEEPNTPIFLEAFRELKQEGKIRAWGVSTSQIQQLQRFNAEGDCDVLQVDYSILNRTAEEDLFPYCLEHGIGVIVRGPIGMGLLAGKFDIDTIFPEDDFRGAWISDPEQNQQFRKDLDVVARLKEIAPDGQSLAQFALRFAVSHPAVTTIIPGARNATQSAANSQVVDLGIMSAAEMDACNQIVGPGQGRRIWPAE